MQAGIVALLVVMAAFSWRDRSALLFLGATLLLPVGVGYAMWTAYQRDRAAREAGMWTPETDAAERKRMFTIIGVVALVWVLLAGAIVLLL